MYERLQELCKLKGITITNLCIEITGSPGNLGTWKKGNINPVSLIKIADFFNVSADYLLGRTDTPTATTETYIAGDNHGIQNVKTKGTVNIGTLKKEADDEKKNIVDVLNYKQVEFSIYSHTKCPFCNADVIEKVGLTENTTAVSFYDCKQVFTRFANAPAYSVADDEEAKIRHDSLLIVMLRCPFCEKISSYVYDTERKQKINIYPKSIARQFPDTVPEDIVKDYTEACEILTLSPNASATLSRRCLQKMIRNRWGIELSKLFDEICTIPETNISNIERNALHAIREIGNIGAHPDKILEVAPEDAEMTIKVIELFLQRWYIDEPKENETLLTLTEIKNRKKEEKKGGE